MVEFRRRGGRRRAGPWFPYRFPYGRVDGTEYLPSGEPWFPYRFPYGRVAVRESHVLSQPWFPYRFPYGRVHADLRDAYLEAVVSLPISLW